MWLCDCDSGARSSRGGDALRELTKEQLTRAVEHESDVDWVRLTGVLRGPSSPPHDLHTKHEIIRKVCKLSLLCSALYAKCHYYAVLYMQSVLVI